MDNETEQIMFFYHFDHYETHIFVLQRRHDLVNASWLVLQRLLIAFLLGVRLARDLATSLVAEMTPDIRMI